MAKVLVIEDNPELAKVLLQFMEIFEHQGQWVESGEEGIAWLKASKYLPDIILCDLTLPEMDGIGVLHAVRSHPMWAQIRFVGMSGKLDDKDEMLAQGANGFLEKPFYLQELQKVLNGLYV